MKKSTGCCNHFLNSFILAVCFSIFLQILGLGNVKAADSQLRAEIGPNKSYVILENSQIYVKYSSYYHLNDEFAIKEFKIKSAGDENQVGVGSYNYFDADAGRGALYDAYITNNGVDKKTVRLIWFDKYNNPDKKITHEVTIFANSKYLKIDYINIHYGVNVVDLGQPGGTASGTHVAYGHSGWDRDYITHQESEFHGSYYNRYPPDGVNDPADGGSLNYNGHFILGVYNPANGRGFARVMPVADTSIVKLLLEPTTRRGLEMFPYPFFQSHDPFTGYLYVVTGGESEILSVGKQLAGGSPQGFTDVPPGHWAEEAIYKIYYAGITKGCSVDPLLYCPDEVVSKAAMAVFLLRSLHGGDYTPPSPTGIFTDVDVNQWYAPWVEQLYREGITKGCSADPLMYCPDRDVSKASMAIFLLRAKYGANYIPPTATGVFTDVDLSNWTANWIEKLYNDGITNGCSADPLMYCPDRAVSRAAMAVFLVRTFGL